MDQFTNQNSGSLKRDTEKKPVVISKKTVTLGKYDVDTTKCVLKGKFEGIIKEELSFEIIPKNNMSETINVDIKTQFKARLVEDGPRIRMIQNGFTFASEQSGTFVVKVIYSKTDQEIAGSPFSIKMNDDTKQERVLKDLIIQDEYVLPTLHHFLAGFNPHTQEFYLKQNVMSNTIDCYDSEMKHTRSFEFPINAWTICFDSEGNIYCGDNKNSFYKFDSNLKKVWSTNVPDKCALGVCTDGEFIYGTLHKGPIFKLDKDTGDIIDKIQLSVTYSNVFNIGFYKDCLFAGDKKDILIYDKFGFHIKTINEWEHTNFIVLGDNIYGCQNKTNKWTKLIVDLTPKEE